MFGLFALTLMAGFAVNAHAQTVSENIEVSANLQQELIFSSERNIVFGNVPLNNVAVINPTDGSRTNASTGQTGLAQLSGQASTTINVIFETVVELSPGSGDDRIYLHLDVNQRNGELNSDEFGGTSYNSGAELTFPNPGFISFFLGGTLSGADDNKETVIPTGHATGAYTGTFTLTATYN